MSFICSDNDWGTHPRMKLWLARTHLIIYLSTAKGQNNDSRRLLNHTRHLCGACLWCWVLLISHDPLLHSSTKSFLHYCGNGDNKRGCDPTSLPGSEFFEVSLKLNAQNIENEKAAVECNTFNASALHHLRCVLSGCTSLSAEVVWWEF